MIYLRIYFRNEKYSVKSTVSYLKFVQLFEMNVKDEKSYQKNYNAFFNEAKVAR